jgi:fumarate reductase flavoprotein subunit
MPVVFDDGARLKLRVPVFVIGAGACGLVAALAARDAGAEVLVLERDASPSGSTALSSGFVPAAGTRFQRDAGVADSAALLAADIRRKNHGEADAASWTRSRAGRDRRSSGSPTATACRSCC